MTFQLRDKTSITNFGPIIFQYKKREHGYYAAVQVTNNVHSTHQMALMFTVKYL